MEQRRRTLPIQFCGFARADSQDAERTHADIRELYLSYESGNWDLLAGINKVFWGVAESRHLVDVINQTDLVEDIDQEDKLGQAMINLNMQKDWGRIGIYLLPWFRERTFPGMEGRLRGPLPVENDAAQYESAAEQHHLNVALRYSHYFGDVDIGLHLFEGTNREPLFTLNDRGQLYPEYKQMTQLGLDLQYTGEAWLWKLEAIARDTEDDEFLAAVAGFEYTRFQIAETDADLGLLLEYQYDGRDTDIQLTTADNDLFVGARLALNDIDDTSILAGAVHDLETEAMFYNLEGETRIAENLNAELRLRIFSDISDSDPLFPFRNDDYVQIRLSWFY